MSDREPIAEISMDITKVKCDELMNYIGITYKNMGEGLFTGTEMIQRYCLSYYSTAVKRYNDQGKSYKKKPFIGNSLRFQEVITTRSKHMAPEQ